MHNNNETRSTTNGNWTYKTMFLEKLVGRLPDAGDVQVLELGCGTAPYVDFLLRNNPAIRYVGVEQHAASITKARASLEPWIRNGRAELLDGFGEHTPQKYLGSFDLVYSLSVVEHVKRIRQFLQLSVAAAKVGGLIAHRYDLGHALHSRSIRERVKIAIANRIPSLVPASHFTFRPKLDIISKILEDYGAAVTEVRYAQMPSLKKAMNRMESRGGMERELMTKIVEIEAQVSEVMRAVCTEDEVEDMFPSVEVFARRCVPAP